MGIKTFVKTKMTSFFAKNTSVEDQLNRAGDMIITEITNLGTRYYTAEAEIARIKKLISAEKERKAEKDREIKGILAKNPEANVTDKARMALLISKIIAKFEAQTAELKEVMESVVSAGKELKVQQQEIASRLELIRETNRANSFGIDTSDDVNEIVGITKTTVEDIMMRIETFKGTKYVETATDIDVEAYIDSLK